MDEPCSALDPISTRKIEELILTLKDYTIIIVPHMQQAQRISEYWYLSMLGELIEYGTIRDIFNNPEKELTHNYVNGHFG
jgi:phosphate transport system ATP-binding protein